MDPVRGPGPQEESWGAGSGLGQGPGRPRPGLSGGGVWSQQVRPAESWELRLGDGGCDHARRKMGAAGEELVHAISGSHGESPAAGGPGVLHGESKAEPRGHRERSRVPEVVPNAGVLGGWRGASLFRWPLGREVLAGPWYRPLLLSRGQVHKHPVRFLSASIPQAPPGTRCFSCSP